MDSFLFLGVLSAFSFPICWFYRLMNEQFCAQPYYVIIVWPITATRKCISSFLLPYEIWWHTAFLHWVTKKRRLWGAACQILKCARMLHIKYSVPFWAPHYKTLGHWSVSGEGQWREGSGAHVLWGEAEGTGIVQFGEEQRRSLVQGRHYCSLLLLERRLEWGEGLPLPR